jgi:hypothetical protein
MPELPPETDQFQQEPFNRILRLAQLLQTTWSGFNIKAIRRDPAPSQPPDPSGPKTGRWIAEIA